jgi:DNA-binding GntR family transcriptional regulator
MVADHHTSERVYAWLKADLLDGASEHGRLNINILAQRYDVSATPVREALLRLVGEGLVEMPSSGGFALPRMNTAFVADCYAFSLDLGLLLLRHLPSRPGGMPIEIGPSSLRYPIDAVTTALAVAVGNGAILRSVLSLNDRMHPIRRMEEYRLPGLDVEFRRILDALKEYKPAAIRKLLFSYHRRRQKNVEKILGLRG